LCGYLLERLPRVVLVALRWLGVLVPVVGVRLLLVCARWPVCFAFVPVGVALRALVPVVLLAARVPEERLLAVELAVLVFFSPAFPVAERWPPVLLAAADPVREARVPVVAVPALRGAGLLWVPPVLPLVAFLVLPLVVAACWLVREPPALRREVAFEPVLRPRRDSSPGR